MSTSRAAPICSPIPPSLAAPREPSVEPLREPRIAPPGPPPPLDEPGRLVKPSPFTACISAKIVLVFSSARVAPAKRGFSSPLEPAYWCVLPSLRPATTRASPDLGDGGREPEPVGSPSARAASALSALCLPFTARYAEPRSRIASQ